MQSDPDEWHIGVNGRSYGPFPFSALAKEISEGRLAGDTLVWRSGMTDWVRAEDLRGLFVVAPATPPPARPIARSGRPESTQAEPIGTGSSMGIPQPARKSLLLLFTLVAVGVAATIGSLYLIILAVGAIAY